MMKLALFAILLFFVGSAFAVSCGPFGEPIGTDCLCASFTDHDDTLGCVAIAEGTCGYKANTTVGVSFVDKLYSKVRSIGFEGTHLVIHVQWLPIESTRTDVIIKTKSGTTISSLAGYLAGAAVAGETWGQYLDDDTDPNCQQVVVVNFPWPALASTENQANWGLFEFDIFTVSTVKKDKDVIKIRNSPVDATVTDVIPVTIHFNATVTTAEFFVTNFTLAFDVNVTFFLRSAYLDPITLNLTVIVQHNISYPLSFESVDLEVLVGGVPVDAFSFETYNAIDCPAQWIEDCQGITTVNAQMPVGSNCTDQTVQVLYKLKAACVGPNNNASSTLCPGVIYTLHGADSVEVKIPLKYNFCPTYLTTEVSVNSFTLYQNELVVAELAAVDSHSAINGTIFLNVDKKVNGSVLYFAKIVSVKLFEKVPTNPNSAAYVDITSTTNVFYGFMSGELIEIFFTYAADYDLITTFLQNWAQGIYFEVIIDVAFTAPGVPGATAKRSTFKSFAKLQSSSKPTSSDIVSVDKATASSATFTFDKVIEEKYKNANKQVAQNIDNSLLNQKLNLVKEKNDKMLVAATASIGGAVLVALVAIIVVISVMVKKNKDSKN